MTESTPKFNIEQDNQELKLYMFTVQNGVVQLNPPVPEDFKAVMAYNDLGAIEMVRKDYPAGLSIVVNKRAQVEVKKIIDVVNIQPSGVALTPQNVQIMVTPPEPREKKVTDFINGMMLIADKFVVDKRDQASIKRILKKIKLHEDQTITESNSNVA